VLKLKIVESNEVITVDVLKLPGEIQDHLKVSGAGHKLGDAAAGKEGPDEIKAAILHVLKGLEENKWTTRAPAGSKITKATIEEAAKTMDPKDRAVIENMMKKIAEKAAAKAKAEAAKQ
jgi:hypothetical protein